MPRPRLRMLGLAWDDGCEAHVSEHIDPALVDEMVEHGRFKVFENSDRHPPSHWIVVGPTESGNWVTAILKEPDDGDEYGWKPITAWRSTDKERRMHQTSNVRKQDRG